MPELPEVETTRRGIEPLVRGCVVDHVELRTAKLRWPLDPQLSEILSGQTVAAVSRRAKYLLFHLDTGRLLLHLGMTGNLRVVPAEVPPAKHDHFDLVFSDGRCLRLTDPRRFGAVVWLPAGDNESALLSKLGPEPLSDEFDGTYLHAKAQGRKLAVKPFIMDQQVVVGVGNIYASEALFMAGIRPDRAAGCISMARYSRLVSAIKVVLQAALSAGGTTFSDFRQVDGKPGYFKQELQVYGREGKPCLQCGESISVTRLGQRSTFYCRHCQK